MQQGKLEKQVLKPGWFQRIIGYAADVCGIGIVVMLMLTVGFGWEVMGKEHQAEFACGLGFVVCAGWWLVLDWVRRGDERDLNQEYEEELAKRQARARRQYEIWTAQLARQQAEVRRQYEDRLRAWQNAVATAEAETRRQQAQWESRLAAEQAEARRQYEDHFREWQIAVTAIQVETKRQEKEWAAQLAAKQAEAWRQYEDQLLQMRNVAATIEAETRRQREEWETQLAAEEADARREYEGQRRAWQNARNALLTEVKKQQEQWESQQATQRAEAYRREEEELANWHSAVAALKAEATRRQEAVEEARQRVKAAEHNWAATANRFASEYDKKKGELQRLRDRHAEVTRGYDQEHQRLQADAKMMQYKEFLQVQFVSDHQIEKIGPGRTVALAAYGIETAFDVDEDRVRKVPGFGPELTRRLVEWRRDVESRFVFNPAAGIPPHMQQGLDSMYTPARLQLEAALISGERELKGIAASAESQLQKLKEHIKLCLELLAQADLDTSVIPPGL